MKILTVTLCLFAAYCASGQQKMAITVAPLAAIDKLNYPTLTLGLCKRIKKNKQVSAELGIPLGRVAYNKSDSTFAGSFGIRSKFERRRFFQLTPHAKGFYWGLNVYLNYKQYNQQITYKNEGDTTTVNPLIYKDAFLSRNFIFGGNVILGKQFNLSKRMVLDLYGGMGTRFFIIAHKHMDYNTQQHRILGPKDLVFPMAYWIKDANSYPLRDMGYLEPFAFALSAGFRLSYAIHQ